MAYPATTFEEAVDLSITAANQQHQIINGSATEQVQIEDGSYIPTVRKALVDNLYFKSPIAWSTGTNETVFNQLRSFPDPVSGQISWWYAPNATNSNPILMPTNPTDSSNWVVYGLTNNALYQVQKRLAAEAGYTLVGTTFLGCTFNSSTDVVLNEFSGKYYNWTGTFPHVVTAGTDPTAVGSGYVSRTDVVLRDEIANTDSAVLISGTEAGDISRKYQEMPSITDPEFGAVSGNVDSSAALALCESSAHAEFYVPGGVYYTTSSRLTKRYVGPGIVRTDYRGATFGNGNPLLNSPSSGLDALKFHHHPIKINTALRNAWCSGVVKVAIAGDSRLEVCDGFYGNSIAANLDRILNSKCRTTKFEFTNFSLLGRALENLNDDGFVAGDPATTVQNAAGSFWRDAFPHNAIFGTDSRLRNSVWPNGSVIGKSWLNHVKDSSPDIIVVGLGTNNLGEVSFEATIVAFEAKVATWTKVPFLVFVTPETPSYTAQADALSVQQSIPDMLRGICRDRGYGLIDAHAVGNAVMLGSDALNPKRLRERNFYDHADASKWAVGAGWTFTDYAASGFKTRATINSSPSLTIRKVRARDVDLSCKFTISGSDAVPYLLVRSASDSSQNQGIQVRIESGILRVYWGTRKIVEETTTISSWTTGSVVTLRAAFTNELLEVWVNNVKEYSARITSMSFYPGSVGFGFDVGSGSVEGYELEYAPTNYQQSPAVRTEYQVFGPPAGEGGGTIDGRDGPEFQGGDGLHHMASEGSHSVYLPAVNAFANKVIDAMSSGAFAYVEVFSETSTATAETDIAGAAVSVNGSGLCKVTLDLPYINQSSTAATVSLVSGSWSRAWYLEPTSATQRHDSFTAMLPVSGVTSIKARWFGDNIVGGGASFPILLTAEIK